MLTRKFWKQVAERAVKTFAQAAVAVIAGDELGMLAVDWLNVLSVAGLAAIISVFTSLGSGAINEKPTPSLVKID
ncbi:holin [Phytohabitans sp. LJ34]|uniref:holin n=1 Tax=Phytohabitans sp. LJ34 TaxID=3452217 RepID=UPI003F89141D